jgi:Eukaryotic protein of unknown function (DUF1764)
VVRVPVSVSPAYAVSFTELDPLGRKTDEGFNIYKEDELGINVEAGGQSNPTLDESIYVPSGTSLCPFDCNCCECPASVLTEM